MKEEINAAIKKLSDKAGKEIDAGKAMHFSQAVLNMAQAKAALSNNKR